MKLKKSVKIIFVFILLGGIVGGFYTFNSWFFSKYKMENKTMEEKEEQQNGKEIMNDFENLSDEEKSETSQEENKTSNNSSKNKNKKRASEIYYCSDGDTLEGKECITKSVTDALKMQVEDTRDYYKIEFNFFTLAKKGGVEVEELKSALKEVCENEINGFFEINENNSQEGSCVFTNMEEDTSYFYKCLDSSYTLEGTKCIKEEKIPAKVRYGCPDGYKQEGIYCME